MDLFAGGNLNATGGELGLYPCGLPQAVADARKEAFANAELSSERRYPDVSGADLDRVHGVPLMNGEKAANATNHRNRRDEEENGDSV